jgi:4-amino-4-deoxy-L-arabinose transferase-like glycosyltransferase
MMLDRMLARWSRGWRGPATAAFIACLAALPGLIAAPVLDRDEARFAQATSQMLETGDFVVIKFQDQPRFKKPVGIHWMQALSVEAFSSVGARDIWAYRLPSLLGAMLAAAACAWGAAAFFDRRTALVAGAMLGASFVLSTEGFIAKTDAMLAGTTTLALAALGRLYAAHRGGLPLTRGAIWLFWIGLGLSTLIKGPVGPLIVALTMIALLIVDRKPAWLAKLRWYWGLLIVAVIVGPWAGAVTVATDGGFWGQAIAADLAPKLAGGQETHGGPFGFHTLLAPLLAFPMTLLLPAGLVVAWTRRDEPGVRFALAWLLPVWLLFELMPTKLPHYLLPTYAALAWLSARALAEPIGPIPRWTGAVLASVVGLALAGGVIYLLRLYGDPGDTASAAVAAILLAAAGLIGAWLLVKDLKAEAVAVSLVLGVLGHGALLAGLAPRLDPLWLSARTERIMAAHRLLPRQGLAESPVAVAGYAEPSLVFALGADTELHDAEEAAQAIAEARPAVVEAQHEPAFQAALKARRVTARLVGVVEGLNYSKGDETTLRIYVSAQPATAREPRE